MAKKRTKKPTESRITLKKTEAPKLLSRDELPAVEAMPVEVVEVVEVKAEAVESDSPVKAELWSVAEPSLVESKPATKPALEHWMIAQRAFGKFAARGYTHGHALEDWLTAESELRSERM